MVRRALAALFLLTTVGIPARAVVALTPIPGGEASIAEGHGPYKNNRELSDAYLKGVADGFSIGIRGGAAQLTGPQNELTVKAAHTNGFSAGYAHGRRLFQFITQEKGYRQVQ